MSEHRFEAPDDPHLNPDPYALAQVVNIITLGSGTGSGGFFPEGLTGVINGTAGSGAAASLLPPALPPAAPAPAPVASAPAPSTGEHVLSCSGTMVPADMKTGF